MTAKRRRPEPSTTEEAPRTAEREFLEFIWGVLESKRAEDLICLEVGKVTPIADIFVIATVANPRQGRAIREEIEKERKKRGHSRVGIEGDAASGWIILDYGSLVVHLFGPEQRAYYSLEHLWSDAPRVTVGA